MNSSTDIAIIGMSGRFPGAASIAEFWENLVAGRESIVKYTDDELRAAGVDEGTLRDPNYVKAGGSLRGFADFDAGFFGFSPKDATIMDPQLRVFLECVHEAFERAGYVPSRVAGAVGVFAGCGMNSYFMFNVLSNPDLVRSVGMFLLRHTGNDRDFMPTTVSYKLNLKGPSVAVQTACSTSLVATHYACQSLLSGECDMAVAGGVTILLPHGHGYTYRENEIHSPDGHCRAFDKDARGTVIASGAGAVILRRLDDALGAGDHIHAVIKGSAVNNDGSGKVGYLAPSVDGHAAAVTEALSLAGLSADDIGLVEAHGTGTLVGDPIEIAALTQAYRRTSAQRQYCAIGSVKASIGHLDTAAGVTALIKTALAVEHGLMPKSLNFSEPNPAIDFASSPFFVNTKLREWPNDRVPRRAGISSLGVGGTNAHVVLEEPPVATSSAPRRPEQLLVLSAKTPSALDRAAMNLAAHLETHPKTLLADAAFTLLEGRQHFEFRRAVAGRNAAEIASALRDNNPRRIAAARAAESEPKVVFLFSGGGAQYPGMGRGLYETEAAYREVIDRCAARQKARIGIDIREVMFPAPDRIEWATDQFCNSELSLPAVFATEMALLALWRRAGVRAAATSGHSLGEYAAAVDAGVLSVDDAFDIVALRGKLAEQAAVGAMLSIPLAEMAVRDLLGDDLDLAVVNGPEMCVVSGREDAVAALESDLCTRGIDCRRLRIRIAAHSRLLDPILDEFRNALRRVSFKAPEKPYVSNLTGTWVRPDDARDPDYWTRHLRETVRFADGLAVLQEIGDHVQIEVGPGQALCSLTRQQPKRPRAAFGSLPHPEDPTPADRTFMTAVGHLVVHGGRPDWAALREGERRLRVPLPTYPFERSRFWIEPGKPAVAETTVKPLVRVADPSQWFWTPSFERAPLTGRGSDAAHWLIFLDGTGVGSAMARLLKQGGKRVTIVREGDAYYRFSDDEFALAPEAGVDGYVSVLTELAASGSLPDRIVHLWLVTANRSARPGSSFFHHVEERGFYSLVFLAQALAGTEPANAIHCTLVANGMESVSNEGVLDPEKAVVLGPVRVIPREIEKFTSHSIDVVLPAPAARKKDQARHTQELEDLASRLIDEAEAAPADLAVAYRGVQRFERRYVRASLPDDAGVSSLPKDGGAYMITGGLGDLGLALAAHLAKTKKARLLLTGRRALPPRMEWDERLKNQPAHPTTDLIRRVGAIENAGAQVLAVAGDVADVESMRAAVAAGEAAFGRLNGVFHAAGVTEDGLIVQKSQEAMERVLAPKVQGTLVLAEIFKDRGLDFFVAYSSTSAFLGPQGQAEYAAANAFLDAFAESSAAQGLGRVTSVAWGIWSDAGLAHRFASGLLDGTASESAPRRAVSHPLLSGRVDAAGGKTIFEARYAAREFWILDEHRTKDGRAIVPGTAYLELARAAAVELDGAGTIEIRNLTFLEPLEVGDIEACDVRVEVQASNGTATFEVKSRASGAIEWRVNATGGITRTARTPAGCAVDDVTARCTREFAEANGSALVADQEHLLRFGPRWRSLRTLRIGDGEALAHLELPEAFATDLDAYLLHPALMDIATGGAVKLAGVTASDTKVWVPLSYDCVRVGAPLPRSFQSWIRRKGAPGADGDTVSFDIALVDDQQRPLVEIEGYTMRRIDLAALKSGGDGTRRVPSGADHPRSAEEKLFREALEAGIPKAEGVHALERVLNTKARSRVIVSSIDVNDLIDRFRAPLAGRRDETIAFSRPELASDFVEPRDEVERTIAGFFRELLGVDQAGIDDSFFDLGGHSLVAVRLMARIKAAFGFDRPISVLFDAPTVARLADLVRSELGIGLGDDAAPVERPEPFRYLVPIGGAGAPADAAPFFLVAGMFGNVLNLRHLGARLGSHRRVYAIQARGLFGEDEPHETFEEMADAYLDEVRRVQPHGPYLFGGFSGGGVAAYEMAQKTLAAGESVAILAMLDSVPPYAEIASKKQRLIGHVRKTFESSPLYFWKWAKQRVAWEVARRRAPVLQTELTPAEFRSGKIEQAFRAALRRYTVRPYPNAVELFRPLFAGRWGVGGGRMLNERFDLADRENFWNPFVKGGITVHEVIGTHDSMVLEPYVRVLGARLRDRIEAACVAAGMD